RARRNWMRYQVPLLFAVVGCSILFREFIRTYGSGSEVIYHDYSHQTFIGLLLSESLAFFFLLITLTFVPLGHLIGKQIAAIRSPLEAYATNIAGSILGVLLFTAISFLQLEPWAWFLIALAPVLWLLRAERPWLKAHGILSALLLALVWWAGLPYIWTPYNK